MIAIGNAAFALARRLQQSQQQPENVDALTVLDTQSNLGAVSKQNAQAAGEKAVKAKPPKITVSVGPDGEPTIEAKNLPAKSQIQQVRDAESAPMLNFADTLEATVAQSARLASHVDPEHLPTDPAAMADELGIQRPRFDLRTGLIGLLESRRDYARLLRNSDRLSEALRELRTKRKEEYLTLGSTAAKDLKQLQSMQKADQAMEVQAAREKRQEQSIVFRVLGDKDFNLSRVATSPDEAVKYMKGLAGENWDDSFEPFVKAKYGQELIDDARKKSDELRKEHDEQLRDKRLELAIAALARNNQKTEEQKTDAENVADAIMNGQQPPELTGLYRNSLAVRSALAKKGYNLTTAQEDWNAMKKRIATMNGAQMVRLQQAVNFTSDSLDIIEDLAHQWKAGGFPALNKARLAAAKSGALGPAAQSLATRLESQINDMVSELGTVYRGGNASTDEALRLASANLKADWSEKTLLDNIAQVRKNLRIRQNSMASAATIPGNHYAPEVQTPAPGAGDQSDPLGIRKFLPKKK